MNLLKGFKEAATWFNRDKIILRQVKKNNSIVYGAQAAKRQLGFFGRPTTDYDILSKRPGKSARQLERTLDRKSGGDFYFTRPAMHPGTVKVKHKGFDQKADTKDDLEVADFTRPKRRYKTTTINGVRYVTLSEVAKDKQTSLKDKEFAFRHQKDRDDLNRIRAARRLRRFG